MARPRTPLGKAELTGAAAHDPQRFRHRSEPASDSIGFPPDWLDEDAKSAWNAFVSEWPWLTKSDEPALASLCVMRATLQSTRGIGLRPAFFSEYRMQLSSFGGNPTSKTKVYVPKDEDDADPFAQFDA